jgi:hypothetical protein
LFGETVSLVCSAVLADNRKFLAHPLSQIILGDLWMGGLHMRKNPGFKIIIGKLFCFEFRLKGF